MVQKINFSARAVRTFESAIEYLSTGFSETEVLRFTTKVEEKMRSIKENPYIGRGVNNSLNVYKTVINKRIEVYYQYKPRGKEILILVFWNTQQNPKKLSI
jgi:plasmid stabilization system protein ParE